MIYFVGAGPGAPDLITVRGQTLLQRAKVVIYAGSLVNPRLLELCPKEAEFYDSAHMHLEEVLAVMEKAHEKGRTCVRLHSGDPSLFGAIREQMDALLEKDIPYAVCPGVSSMGAAAAALQTEFTLPQVAQSVIITRIEGRTPVPERERLSKLAESGATMVIFLSAAYTGKVQEELLKGIYTEDTPCAIVYKASWPQEKVIRGKLGQLRDMAEENGIRRSALIVVGEVLQSDYALSGLYSAHFATAYRPAVSENHRRILLISYTEAGRQLSGRIREEIMQEDRQGSMEAGRWDSRHFGQAGHREVLECYAGGNGNHGKDKVFLERYVSSAEVILFISATGIAIRRMAPFLENKLKDPAVLCMDDTGHYVISLLSGHMGGANRWCKKIAELVEAEPVITTATDRHDLFAVDVYAMERHLSFRSKEELKEISAALLRGEEVGFFEEGPESRTPDGLVDCREISMFQRPSMGVHVSYDLHSRPVFRKECLLYGKKVFLGIGCKKGILPREVEGFVLKILDELGLSPEHVEAMTSIDRKMEEKGLLAFSEKYHIPFITYTADELKEVPGDFTASHFVEEIMGVDNVCERSAMCAAGINGILILRKQVGEGVTLALAERGAVC